MNQQPVGVLLAAGRSQRFGSNKLLYPVIADTPMLFVSARNFLSALAENVVVIGKELVPYTAELEQLGMTVVINEQPERGMGTSIACGVNATRNAPGWLIALADMPYIKQQTIMQVAKKLQNGAKLVAPVYQQQRGHPVGFSTCYQEELIALDNDTGARRILEEHFSELEIIPVDDAGVITDIDRMTDIKNQSE